MRLVVFAICALISGCATQRSTCNADVSPEDHDLILRAPVGARVDYLLSKQFKTRTMMSETEKIGTAADDVEVLLCRRP